MFYKILLITSLVNISLGSTDPQKRSNQATYSLNFIREDVPLSYQYSAVHNYAPKRLAPEEPMLTKNYNNPNLKAQELIQKHIQFAPLPNQKKHSYEMTGHSAISKDNSYETQPLYTSVFRNPIIEYQQNEHKISEDSAPSTIKKHHLEPKPLPIEAKNAKPFTYKPHVNHKIKIHQSPQSPHVSSLNNYYENTKYPFHENQVKTQAALNLDTGDFMKYLNIYQQGLYPEQQVTTCNYVALTATESPNLYREQNAPLKSLLQESNVYLSKMPTDPRLTYYNEYRTVPMLVRTFEADTKQEKHPKYSRYNYVRFQPKNHQTAMMK